MTKCVINARQVVRDLRSGISKQDLMVKYRLSNRSVDKVFAKLVEIGVLRRVNVKHVLRDIRSGVTNSALMQKYQLSPKALEKLFLGMTDAGISFFRERQANNKKRVSVREIVRDVRQGLSETELMQRHELSSRGLQSALWKLVDSGVLTWGEVLGAYADDDGSEAARRNRQWTRGYPVLSVHVLEESHPENVGKVKDLTEKGLGVTGMLAQVNEQKTLVVVPDEYLGFKSFSIGVACKWYVPPINRFPSAAGFAIIAMDKEGFEGLQEVLQLTTLLFD